jgi:outer membrane lipoprotein-sorting protein
MTQLCRYSKFLSLASTLCLTVCLVASPNTLGQSVTGDSIIRDAINHSRGVSSVGEMSMTIHRPDWERSMTMQAWTQGDETSLVRVVEPAKDAGNATLIDGDNMWSFAPRINRVIKVPSSMMGQSWMGSDFSNKDISKGTDALKFYTHKLLDTQNDDEHTVYVIESTPLEDAPVVWGKEIYHIRDDYVILRQEFWSQDGELVKYLETHDIEEMGGRVIPTRMRMQKSDTPDEWTEIIQHSAQFNVELSDNLFTLSNLRNPRQ